MHSWKGCNTKRRVATPFGVEELREPFFVVHQCILFTQCLEVLCNASGNASAAQPNGAGRVIPRTGRMLRKFANTRGPIVLKWRQKGCQNDVDREVSSEQGGELLAHSRATPNVDSKSVYLLLYEVLINKRPQLCLHSRRRVNNGIASVPLEPSNTS